jgi:mannosyltransferase OCH1-like enzyme
MRKCLSIVIISFFVFAIAVAIIFSIRYNPSMRDQVHCRIPKIVWMTWKNENLKSNVRKNINRMKIINPNYTFKLVTDDECDAFIKEYFPINVYSAYSKINPKFGAARADFWRYCVLYVFGGIYLDLDVRFNKPIDKFLRPIDDCMICTESKKYPYAYNFIRAKGESQVVQQKLKYPADEAQKCKQVFGKKKVLLQCFMAYAPKHRFMKATIDEVVNNIVLWEGTDLAYLNPVVRTVHITGPAAYTKAVVDVLKKENKTYNTQKQSFVCKDRYRDDSNMYEKNNENDYHKMQNVRFCV